MSGIPNSSMMRGNRLRIILLLLVLTAVACATLAITLVSWHRAAINQQSERLVEIVRSQARLMEAVARFNRLFNNESFSKGWVAATIQQLRDAHEQDLGIGESGEFTLARRQSDQIIFLLSRRHSDVNNFQPVPWDSDLAEPMRLALNGESGIVEGIDYRGVKVLAAHEPVAELGLGIVAKIDLREVRAPYIKAGLVSALCAFGFVVLGAFLFIKITNPLVDALEKSERLYRGVYSCAPLAFVIWDRECRVVDWNDHAEELFGWTAEEAIGRNFFDIIVPKSAQPQVEHVVTALLNGEFATHSVNENLTKDGEILLCEWNTVVLKDSNGDVTGAFSLGLDITQRKRSEAEMKRLAAELAAKNRELEQIIYVASHDLRSPLVNVQGYSSELQYSVEDLKKCFANSVHLKELLVAVEPILEHDIPESLRFIRSGVIKMDGLLSGLLRICRLGRAALKIETLNMNQLMRAVTNQIEYQIRESGATVEVHDLPPCLGDSSQVNQVFSNLLDNALKYIDLNRKAHIRITGEKADVEVIYNVEDNGIGISADQLDRVFEVFHQVNSTTDSGEGLGLSIVQRCVSKLGGSVHVQSIPGKGSNFEVRLPAS